jgi:hypothetical protein
MRFYLMEGASSMSRKISKIRVNFLLSLLFVEMSLKNDSMDFYSIE